MLEGLYVNICGERFSGIDQPVLSDLKPIGAR